jgi:hypothetical protein
MDAQLLKNLFGDPYSTNIGPAQDGSLMVVRMMKPPVPMLMFGPQRIQLVHPKLEDLTTAFGKVLQEAHTRTNQQIPLFSQVGINTEHEWSRSNFKPAKRWLAERYVRKGLFDPPLELVAEAGSVAFAVKLTDPARSYNITMEPRADVEEGIFAGINDHRDWHKKVPTGDELASLIKESISDIENRLTPLLLGGVAENA